MARLRLQHYDRGVAWYRQADEQSRAAAFANLLEHAIDSEWVRTWSPEDAAELKEENPNGNYEAPYFVTTGDPICEADDSGDAKEEK